MTVVCEAKTFLLSSDMVSKTKYYLQNTEMEHVVSDSRQIGMVANATPPAVTQNGRGEV
jgi:hypothetical protein